MDPEIWRGPGSRWTQILDAFTPSAWISGLDSRIWRGLRLAMDADPRGTLAIGDQNIGTRTWELFLLTFPIPEEQGWRDPQTDWHPEA